MSESTLRLLTVERMFMPIGVATSTPLFGWQLPAEVEQESYEVHVSQSGGQVWTSGRVISSRNVDVPYDGPALVSDAGYEWTVQVWSRSGAHSSASSTFETSLLRGEDWIAKWLTPAQLPTIREQYSIPDIVAGTAVPQGFPADRLHPPQQVRQCFHLEAEPARARLYATARGIYAAELNGRPVGDEVLPPGYDSYGTRLSFQTYDVTDHLTAGENVLGVTVADGWYAGRMGITGSSAQYGDELAAIWQLSVTYADGRRHIVGSGDGPAFSHRGGWDYADLFIGERFDARAVTSGWSTAAFDASDWKAARVDSSSPRKLVAFAGEPVRRTAILPAGVQKISPKSYLIDLGQNIAGRLVLRLRAAAATTITIDHSEVLLTDGTFFHNIVGPNKDQRDEYIASGSGDEVYEPTFTFHGFRYATLTATEAFEVLEVSGVVLGTDLRLTSELHTSDDRINKLHQNIVWSQRGNFLSIPTDCPQRERAGWTGDVQVYAPAAAANMDVREFLERWLANVRAEQGADGRIPPVVPVIPSMHDGSESDVTAAAGWSDAIALVPWTLYQRYDDRRVLTENYEAMLRWIEYQQREAKSAIPRRLDAEKTDEATLRRHRVMWNTGWQFGDWLAPSTLREGLDPIEMEMPNLRSEIVAAMFHAHSTRIVARVAAVLGYDDDARRLHRRADRIRDAFAQEYVTNGGRLPLELQGHYVLAITFELIPQVMIRAAVARLKELIVSADFHLDTGFLSTPHLLDVLWDHGEKATARNVMWQQTSPSWLYAVERGATTVWESWDAIAPDGTPSRSSFNHYAFGCVDDWIVRRLGGVEATTPGYSEIRIAPDVDGPLTESDCRIETVRGLVRVQWRREGERITLLADVPSGSTARIAVGTAIETVGAGHHRRTIDV